MSSSDSSRQSEIYSISLQSDSLKKPQISILEPVSPISDIVQKCYCRHLWNYELHGLTQFLKSTTIKAKAFWGSFIGACIIVAIVTTDSVFSEYLDRQKVTLITIKHDKAMLYPTIVVCPKNADALNYTLIRADMTSRLPGIDNKTMDDLVAFSVAGAGFDNMGPVISTFNDIQMSRFGSLFQKWKGKRDYLTFYKQLFETFGYLCEDLFNGCYYGSETMDCCKAFTPVYVMLRGRCFQLKNFFQRDPDEVGKVSLYINQIASPLIDDTGLQSQVVIYISDRFPDIATFPRFYLNYKQWNRMRFQLREIAMLPTKGQCNDDPKNQGRATCFVNNWIQNLVVKRFNCTVFYFADKSPDVPICDPEVLVRNYKLVVDPSMKGLQCVPPCLRFDTSVDIYSAEEINTGLYPIKTTSLPAFRLEASYTNLNYESYKEVLTTSLPGFVGQIGGQFGLFLGLSVITLVQFCFSTSKFSIRKSTELAKSNCAYCNRDEMKTMDLKMATTTANGHLPYQNHASNGFVLKTDNTWLASPPVAADATKVSILDNL